MQGVGRPRGIGSSGGALLGLERSQGIGAGEWTPENPAASAAGTKTEPSAPPARSRANVAMVPAASLSPPHVDFALDRGVRFDRIQGCVGCLVARTAGSSPA
jgi:hypothetical protein